MGQKVNPKGLRLGITQDWESKWYAPKKDFGDTLNKDLKIRKFLSQELKNAAVASVIIERTAKRVELIQLSLV